MNAAPRTLRVRAAAEQPAFRKVPFGEAARVPACDRCSGSPDVLGETYGAYAHAFACCDVGLLLFARAEIRSFRARCFSAAPAALSLAALTATG